MNIGKKIKHYRQVNKITQKNLADSINKSIETIKKYENGNINPPIDVLKNIAVALNIPINNFISDGYEDCTDTDKKIIYRLTTESELIEHIFDYFGYSVGGYELPSGDYEFYLYTKSGDRIKIIPKDMDNFILSLKNAIEFEIYKLINSQKEGK